jgi:hypothetical protein
MEIQKAEDNSWTLQASHPHCVSADSISNGPGLERVVKLNSPFPTVLVEYYCMKKEAQYHSVVYESCPSLGLMTS